MVTRPSALARAAVEVVESRTTPASQWSPRRRTAASEQRIRPPACSRVHRHHPFAGLRFRFSLSAEEPGGDEDRRCPHRPFCGSRLLGTPTLETEGTPGRLTYARQAA